MYACHFLQLLLRPIDYGLSTEALTEVAERNIKVLATALLFLVRRVSTRRDSPMLVGLLASRHPFFEEFPLQFVCSVIG